MLKGEERKVKSIVGYVLAVLAQFALLNYFSFAESMMNHLDLYLITVILAVYALICLSGAWYMRIIIPAICMIIHTAIAYLVMYLMLLISNNTFFDYLVLSSSARYLYVITGNLFITIAYWSFYRFSKKQSSLKSLYDIFSFIIIPILALVLIESGMELFQSTGFDKNLLFFILLIIIATIAIVVLFAFLLTKANRDQRIKTDLLLSEQREELYKASVLSSSEQLDRMSKIKHDMKNDLNSIGQLIEEGRVDEAAAFCRDRGESIARIDTPVNTDNPTLNAILNVEINKARAQDIDFVYTVTDSLGFMTASDIVSVIGNLCDNAIEYLGGIEPKMRKMSLNITVKNGYRFITCRNSVSGSVLADNPQMTTTKDDRSLHGKGVAILKDMAEKYHGSLSYREDDGMLEATLIVRDEEAE
jgi:hypothetical protein